MNTRKLKLGLSIGFYSFLTFVLLVGVVFSLVQLWILEPLGLLIFFLLVLPPFLIIAFNTKFKIVRRE